MEDIIFQLCLCLGTTQQNIHTLVLMLRHDRVEVQHIIGTIGKLTLDEKLRIWVKSLLNLAHEDVFGELPAPLRHIAWGAT